MFGAKETIVLRIEGMHCPHCKARVEKALSDVKGVKSAVVDLDQKTASIIVKAGKVDVDTLKLAVSEIGFEVIV